MYKLILLRHGESQWNLENRFTGWVDIPLSKNGIEEAKKAGEILKANDLYPDFLFTSLLQRSIATAFYCLQVEGRGWIDVKRSWRLNERHYGALQGRNKEEVRKEVGEEQFMLWRRSYDTPPNPIEEGSPYSQENDPKYEFVPRTESLKDVLERLEPYWYEQIVPQLVENKLVMVCAHGNSLRALIKKLNHLSAQEVQQLNLPTAKPMLFELGHDLEVVSEKHLEL